jgi:DNA-binding GntR family transcriptional regulator
MLAVRHADTCVQHIQRLWCLMRLAIGAGTHETREDVLAMLEQIAEHLEACVCDDAVLLTTALRHHEQQSWPFPARDPLAPLQRH